MEMDTLPFNNYNVENGKPIFTTATESQATSTTLASFTTNSSTLSSSHASGFSPMAPPFESRVGNDLLTLISQQEPRQADPAPSTAELDDAFMNLRLGQNIIFDDTNQPAAQNYFMGGNRSESVSSLHSTIWNASDTPGPSTASARNGEMIDTFDFLIKSISSANNYVSMLTREQLHVLRSIRPNVLYEFLQEVAKVRNEKRMRRALPNECAFCKNNGENEECYSSHALKDWRGRVLCPVLRAFRCPRCGATGDHAHTIKYCSQNADGGLDRAGSLSSRRRMSSSLVMGRSASSLAPTPTPSLAPSPSPSAPSSSAPLSHAAIWSSFSMN